MKRLLERDFLIVIQYQHRCFRQPREQLAKKAAGKAFDILQIFRRQCGKRPLPFAVKWLGCFAEVVEEGGEIGITGIDLVPDPFDAFGIQPACNKCRLAGPRRTHDTDGGFVLAGFVQFGEQALARHRFV